MILILNICWCSCRLRISSSTNLQSCPKFPQQLPVSGACTRYGIHLMPGEGNFLRLHVEQVSPRFLHSFNKKHQQTIRIHRYPYINHILTIYYTKFPLGFWLNGWADLRSDAKRPGFTSRKRNMAQAGKASPHVGDGHIYRHIMGAYGIHMEYTWTL